MYSEIGITGFTYMGEVGGAVLGHRTGVGSSGSGLESMESMLRWVTMKLRHLKNGEALLKLLKAVLCAPRLHS